MVLRPPRTAEQMAAHAEFRIPDHSIWCRIGAGAYGEVWLARSVMGTFRAVKVVWRDNFVDDASFEREFEGLLHYEPVARLHPNLLHILHVGRMQDNLMYFYVMELADDAFSGAQVDPHAYTPRTLQSDMHNFGRQPMPLDYVLKVGIQMARALDYLHQQDLTHRDVKPANIVFVNGRAKLADAGLVAQGVQQAMVGTQGYVPPEAPGTQRADVYALAKVLYGMGTGKDRLSFPELPESLPQGTPRRLWLQFNEVICLAASPRVEAGSITTAQEFTVRLEHLQEQMLQLMQRGGRGQTFFKRLYPLRWTLTFALAFVVMLVLYLLPHNDFEVSDEPSKVTQHAGSRTSSRLATNLDGHAETSHGQVYIVSMPAGASIYKADGSYYDETPCGPVRLREGTEVNVTLRHEGYAEAHLSGTVRPGEVLTLGGELRPYRPAGPGRSWGEARRAPYGPPTARHASSHCQSTDLFDQGCSGG